jgi:hypothetical protein
LYISKDNQASWIYKGSYVVSGTPGIATQGTCYVEVHDFLCLDIGTDNYFKWEIQDGESTNTYNTSIVQGPNITESQVSISYVEGNDSYVNRSSGINQVKIFTVNVYDSENQSYAPSVNVSFWITHDNTNYQFDVKNTTDNLGNVSYHFNPDCSYSVGKQYWIAGVTDSCYQDINTSSNFTTWIIGDLINTIIQPAGQEFLRGSNITIRANVTNDCQQAMSSVDIEFNVTSIQTSQEFVCSPVLNEGTGYYNCTFNTSSPTVMPTQSYKTMMKSFQQHYNTNITIETYSSGVRSFWIETKPILTAQTVSPSVGGWGERFYFFVNATDEDYDQMTVRLWLRKQGTATWTLKNSTSIQGINVTVELSTTFLSGSDIGTWEYKFNVTGDDSWDVYETENYTFTVEPNDVTIEYVVGNNSVVNRTASLGEPQQNVTFGVRVWDADRNVPITEMITTKFYATTDNVNYVEIGSVTNDSSYFYFQFDPDCNFAVGPQKWLASSAFATTWYKTVNSSELYFNVTTSRLKVAIQQPNNITRVRGVDDILLRGNVTDDCGLVSGATVSLETVRSGITTFTCTANDEGNGWYNCTASASEHIVWSTGWYNVTMEALKQYYNSSEKEIKENAFRLVTVPNVWDAHAVSTLGQDIPGGWGETWTFRVKVQDLDNDDVNIYLWINLTGDWQLINSTVCTSCDAGISHQIEFSGHTFACSNIGTKQFKFNVSDTYGYKNETVSTFVIERDDVAIYYGGLGDGTQIDREGTNNEIFKVRIKDLDKNAYVGSEIPNATGKIYITTDGNNYDSGTINTTDSQGYLYITFDPNCSYSVGQQKWKGATYNDACYKNAESSEFTTSIIGQLKVNLTEPQQNSVIDITVGKIVSVVSDITDECGNMINASTVTHESRSPSFVWESISPVTDLNNGTYNSSWNISYHVGGYWSFRVNTSKSNHYSNSTVYTSWVYLNNTPPDYTGLTVNPPEEGWGVSFNYSVQINDTQQDNVTCTLLTSTDNQVTWINRGSVTVYNGVGLCSINVSNYSCSDIGTDNYFKWEIQDGTNTFNTSVVQGPNITPDDVTIYYLAGNDTSVNRSDSSVGNVVLLILGVNDTDKNIPANATVTFYVTKDGNIFLTATNTTNSSGVVTYYFNPDCNYNPGLQKWKGNVTDSCYIPQETINYTLKIYGDFVYFPTGYRQGEYTDKTALRSEQNITLDSGNPAIVAETTIEDDCGAETDVDTINMQAIHNTTGTSYSCTEITNPATGVYRCNRNTSDMKARWYDVVVDVSKQFFNNKSVRTINNFFIETKPQLINTSVVSTQGGEIGGWGERFYFNVTVTDEDYDFVNLTLYVRRFGAVSWIQANKTNLDSPVINQTVTLSWTRGTCEASQTDRYPHTWEFKFNATDDPNSPYLYEDLYETTITPKNFSLEKDDTSLQLMSGDNEWVWRNGTAYINLSLKVIDADTGNLAGYGVNGSFWVTTDGNNFAGQKISETDVESNLTYKFPQDLPSGQTRCDFKTGVQKWFAGVHNDLCYKDKNSTNHTITIKSLLLPSIVYPAGEGFLRGTLVSVNGSLYDECTFVEGATVRYTFIPQGGSPYQCTISDNNGWIEGEGWYNCTRDTSGKPKGWYNVSMDVSKSYYVSNSTLKPDAFFLGDKPSLSNPRVDHSIGGWGEVYTFTVTFTDADLNINNVSLWKSYDNSTWYLVETKTAQGIGIDVSFTHRFKCSDYFQQSPYFYYKFNTTDPFGFTDETISKNMTLERDDVSLSITPASNSTVRRIGDNLAFLEFRIYDSDNETYPSGVNGTIYVTKDGSNYTVTYNCTSLNGYCSANHNPGCDSSVGLQYWLGGTIEKDGFSCYKIVNSTNASLVVYGQLNISLLYPQSGTILNRDGTTELNSSVKDDCNQTVEDASVNWYNSTWDILATGHNTSWYVSTTYKLGPETIYSNVTREYYDPNSNSTQIYIYGWSDVDSISPANGSTYAAGTVITVKCRIIDSNSFQPIENYMVYFFKNGASFASETTDSDGYASIIWYTTGENAGWYNLTCKIENNSTLYYNTSLSQRETWIKLSRPLIIDQIVVQYPEIYRNNSFTPYKTNISVHTQDASIGNADNSNVTFYNSTSFIGNCTTDSSGWCSLIDFNPSDTITPGPYIIYINATRPQNEDSDTNTTTITVKGILNITIISPSNDSTYPKSQSMPLKANGTSENGESFAELNPTIRWYNETAQIAEGNDTILPQPMVAEQRTGPHQFMAVARKTYYDDGRSNVTVTITGLSDVIWVSPTGIVPYPDTFVPTCLVKDHESEAGISDYVVNFSYKWEPSTDFIFNGSYSTNSTGYASYSFIPTQKGNITFNCTIGDNVSQYYSANIKEVIETFWVKDTRLPQIYNTSIIPNASIEANLNSTNITATITDNYQINSVWANITMPNGSTVFLPMNNITVPETGFGFYKATYRASYLPPRGGVYNVTVFAKDAGPEYNINNTFVGNFSVWGTISGFVEQSPLTIIAFGVTQTQGFTFEVSSNFTNFGPATAYSVNLTHMEDPLDSLVYNETSKQCGTMYAGETCNWTFKVTVPAKTQPQMIRTYVISTWTNPDYTIEQTLNKTDITVSSNPVIEVTPENITKTVPHDATTYVGNMTTSSLGNDEIRDVAISSVGGNLAVDCPLCTLTITPEDYGLLKPGENFTSDISIAIPAGQSPGIYWTKIRASTSNAGYDELLLNLTISQNTSWLRNPESFGTVLLPLNTSGTIGNITVTNVGNVKIPFEILKSGNGSVFVSAYPSGASQTTAFDLEKQTSRNVIVDYSVSATAIQGVYTVNILIRNVTFADPPEYITNMTLNVTDIPPTIENVLIIPTIFEVGYENVTVQAKITDNFAVDKGWINVTLPNGSTFVQFLDRYEEDIYNTTYFSLMEGIHLIKICANDTRSLSGCTSPTAVEGSTTTHLEILPNVTTIIANDTTIEYGQNFTVNITLNNTGGSRALYSNLTINSSSNISAEPSFFDFGTILKWKSKSNITKIIVPNGTLAGLYYLNLSANWTNLNGTSNFTLTSILVNVTSNPKIRVLEQNITKIIPAGTVDNATFTLKSIGNENVTQVNITCKSGVVCEDFNVSFDPQNFSSIPVGEIRYVTSTFEVPTNYQAGTHNGTIEITWYPSFSTHLLVFITIPVNISWAHQPTEMYREVLQNDTGYFGSINITNTGNSEIELSLITNGTIAPYLILSEDNITLPYAGEKTIYINYSSPDIQTDMNFTGSVISNITGALRENVSIKTQTTFVSMFVSVYTVKIIHPTQTNPLTGVNPNSSIQAKVNITANSTIIISNVTFNVSIFNSSTSKEANVTSAMYNNTEKLWIVEFTAPELALARVYNLNITAAYDGTKYLVRSAVEHNSIVYTDTKAPQILISIPVRIPANSTVTIKTNITESGGIKNITGSMKYPDNTTESISLILISKVDDTYVYEFNFTNTSKLGNYTVSVSACDLSGNCNSTSSSFEIYPTAFFSGYAKDVELLSEPPIKVNFVFYDKGTDVERFDFSSNESTGYYNETIDVKSYDLEINLRELGFNHQIVLYDLNINTNYFNPIVFGNIPSVRTTPTMLKGIYLDTVLNYSRSILVLNFSDCIEELCNVPIYDPAHLGIYKYNGNWTPKISSSQNTLWTRITNPNADNSDSSVNLTTFTVTANLTNLEGVYILAEFICGNGECETEAGESTSVCPTDCPALPPPPPLVAPTPVAAGGPGGIAAPAPPAPAPVPAVPSVEFVPVEIKSTLLETTLIPGEEKLFSIDITNNLDRAVSVEVMVEGPAFQLLTIQKPVFTVQAKSTETTSIKAYAPPTLAPGIYTGDLVVTAGDTVHRTPVTIKVKAVLEPLLDVRVKVLSKAINPGTNLTFEISLFNMGQTATIEDITVTYNVRPIADESKIIVMSKETLAVENVLTYRRTIEIPKDTPEGRYIIEANATYWYGSKFAMSSDNFDITVLPLPLFILRAIFLHWATYVILFGGVPAAIIGLKWLSAYRAAKAAKARYIAPIEFKKLPKAGPNAIEVGKIAETDMKAYIDISQLIMHSIAAGGTGSGKTVSAMVCAEELLKRKVPVIVFDPTAQWTGFMKPCRLKAMLDLYPKFGLKPTDARAFKTNILVVEDPDMPIEIKKYMKPGEITVFVMNRLKPEQLDRFVRRSVQAIFDMRPPESKEIKLLLVYDEVHRLLPKYGGKKGYVAIERACREFRKWGIGLFLISQVLLDFKGAIRANIANEIQLRTKYEGDIGRVKSKYGSDYASRVTKLTIGTGLFQNPEYNYGRPWFITFRPLLHSPFALTDKELNQYIKLNKRIEDIEKKIEKLKAKKVDTYDIEIELNIAKDKVKTAAFRMAETYLESLEKRISKIGGK